MSMKTKNEKTRNKHNDDQDESPEPRFPLPPILAVLSVIIIICVLVILSGSDRVSKPQNINGDTLGPIGMSAAEYIEVTQEALKKDNNSKDQEPRWALVSIKPMTIVSVAELFPGQIRVSTLLFRSAQTWVLPEPAEGLTRGELFSRQAERIEKSSGLELHAPELEVCGVLVRATPQQLYDLSQQDSVITVESLPPDAAYGRFGMRPLVLDSGNLMVEKQNS